MISDLYYSGEISGETFLYCVENNINTIDDIVSALSSEKELPENIRTNLLGISIPSLQNTKESPVDNTVVPSLEYIVSEFISVFERRISLLDVRSRNAIEKYRNSCSDDKQFVKKLDDNSAYSEISGYSYVGKGSIKKIRSFIDSINLEIGHYSTQSDVVVTKPCVEIDKRLPLYNELVLSLSVRSQHALDSLLTRANGSLSGLYKILTSPSFSIQKERNVGRKSAKEINGIIPRIIELCEADIDQRLIQQKQMSHDIAATLRTKHCDSLSSNIDNISDLRIRLGYFPLFASVNSFITSLPHNYQTIFCNCINIYDNQAIISRTEISQVIKLTPERIRQLSIKLIKKMSSYLKSVAKYTDGSKYDNLSYQEINKTESTQFNQNFVFWCLSITCPSYSIIGDYQTSFLRPHNRKEDLFLAPAYLNSVFNFSQFKKKITDEIENEHYEDCFIDIDELIYNCFKGRIFFEHFTEIKSICQKLILEQTDCALVDNQIRINKNCQYNIPELIEIILREKGEPMTAHMLLEEVNRKSSSSKSLSSVKAGAINNHNVVPVGRSSTYALKEWNFGNSRGGTIREFALEYLLSLPEPIAPISLIGNYVRQFRPTSRDNSIQYNLLLESSGRFVLYTRNGEKYVGLSSATFSKEFILVDDEACGRRDFRVSCNLIENFRDERGRLPKHNKSDGEEMRLYRFIILTKGKIEKGLLTEDELAIFKQAIDEN